MNTTITHTPEQETAAAFKTASDADKAAVRTTLKITTP